MAIDRIRTSVRYPWSPHRLRSRGPRRLRQGEEAQLDLRAAPRRGVIAFPPRATSPTPGFPVLETSSIARLRKTIDVKKIVPRTVARKPLVFQAPTTAIIIPFPPRSSILCGEAAAIVTITRYPSVPRQDPYKVAEFILDGVPGWATEIHYPDGAIEIVAFSRHEATARQIASTVAAKSGSHGERFARFAMVAARRSLRERCT